MSAIGKLFGGEPTGQATVVAPEREPVPTLTTDNSARVKQAQLLKRRQLSANQGRASTLLDNKKREFQNVELG